jgi:protein ImuB
MRRVVSLYLPTWSTDRLRRQSIRSPSEERLPDRSRPLVTVALDHGRRIVAAADAAAHVLGVRPGMTLTRARSLSAELAVADADPAADLAGLERLALWAARLYTPFAAVDPPDGLWLDISGCEGLFDGEVPLLKDLHRRVARAGLAVQLALADTPGCAHAVARHVPAGRPVIIERGAQRKALGLLPIAALRLDPAIVAGLKRLGFERVEQLLDTPRGPVAKRFGPILHLRLDQALGQAPEALVPVVARHVAQARRSLMEPIATAEALIEVVRALATDIAGQLLDRGAGARRLDLFCHRVDGDVQAIRVGTAAPSRDAAHLAKLLAARIETIEPGFGIETMQLCVPLLEPLGARQRDLADDGRKRVDLDRLVDALANRFGARSLYRAAPEASAMPERTVRPRLALAAPEGRTWSDELPRPSRLIEPPEPIDVTAMLPDHPPAMFVWRRRRYRVTQADGPERLHGEWWRDAGHEAQLPYAVRDYFQVEVEGGGRYWLFRLGDGERPSTGPMRWFIHGAFP